MRYAIAVVILSLSGAALAAEPPAGAASCSGCHPRAGVNSPVPPLNGRTAAELVAQMPKVEAILMPAGGTEPWGGVGEPTICVAAPAVLNSIAKATGKRYRSVPLKNEGIELV